MPTISDVARQAGVSTVTVSRVINNAPNVNLATRRKVEQAIKSLGYVPNVVARSLRSKRTRSLALVVPDITNTFWTTVARGVEDAAQSLSYSVLLCNTDENYAKQLRYLEVVASQRVDGVIIAPCDSDVENVSILRDRNIPTVLIDRWVEGWEADSVRGDSLGGARDLVRHLIDLGHKRIAMVSGPSNTSTAEDRVAGYCAALAEAGIAADPCLIKRGEFRAASGEQLMQQVFAEELNPTAVFAANNAIAMGVIDAVAQYGLRIPHDIALVCFDDFDAASHLFPFLTVAVQPAYEMGVNAAQLLLSRLEAGAEASASFEPRHIVLPTRLIIRHSCGSRLKNNDHSELCLPVTDTYSAVSYAAQARMTLVPPARLNVVSRAPMTSRQRVMTVFQHREPDYVPAWLGASPEFKELARSILSLPDDESLSIYVGDDFRRVYAGFAGPDHRHPTSYLTYPDATYRTPFGVERHGYGYGMPLNTPLAGAKTIAEVDSYPWPDPEWMDVSGMRAEAAKFGGQYAILGGDWSPFWHDAIDLVTFEGLGLLMYDDPEFVDALLTHIVDYYAAVSRRIFEAAGDLIDIFFIGNDFGSQRGPLIGDKQFRRFMLPHLKRLIDLGHEYGLKVLMHCCGGFVPLMPAMIEAGLDGLQALQPTCTGMDMARLKREYGEKIVLMGGIDTQLLIEGTPDQARAETRRVLEIMKPGGGYIASPSHDYLLPETPVENVMAVYETIREYGGYNS